MIELELEVRGLVEAQQAIEKKFEAFDDAVRRALAIVGQRGHDHGWSRTCARVATGAYKRSPSRSTVTARMAT